MPGGGFEKHPENINRKGRPKKGETFTDIIQTELSKENVQVKGENGEAVLISGREAVVRKLITMAIAEGNFPALRYLMDRVDGSPRQSVIMSRGDDGDMSPQEMDELIKKYEGELAEIDKVRTPGKSPKVKSPKKPS